MSSARSRHSAGYTLTEVIIATAIALVAAGVILQVLILTVRTTQQTSAQADVQAQARAALMDWEQLLRDGYAIVTTYTPHEG
ncbi:MAG TPA: prepilin-type N-terminal cleavage/methylation domain-containing protein, partial [Armatimonadota bacterium]|nr:prepilin-type N-terminal cleavage/methylation domain-containing protein [Armatimonadota bacterium]